MEFFLQAYTSWFCCIGSRVLLKLGRKEREDLLCQRQMDLIQQRSNKQNLQPQELNDGSKFKKLQKESEF